MRLLKAPWPPSPAPGSTGRVGVAMVYTPPQIAQALEGVAAVGVRPAAKDLGISHTTLRDVERKAYSTAFRSTCG